MSKSYSGHFNTPVSLTPSTIRYSQDSVNGRASIISSMKENGWAGPPIDVVMMDDSRLTSLDNTRLVAANEVGINVKAVVHKHSDPLTSSERARFTTKKGTPSTWGEAVQYRVRKQDSAWRKTHPYGAYHMEKKRIK